MDRLLAAATICQPFCITSDVRPPAMKHFGPVTSYSTLTGNESRVVDMPTVVFCHDMPAACRARIVRFTLPSPLARIDLGATNRTLRPLQQRCVSTLQQRCVSIVISARNHNNLLHFNGINQSVRVIYSARPESAQIFAKCFGLTDAIEWIAQRRLDQLVDSSQCFFVVHLPPDVVLPRGVGERDLL
jgi:hypothetical protein